MNGAEAIPHVTDIEGREMWRQRERRKSIQLAYEVAKEHRLAKSALGFHDWLRSVSVPLVLPDAYVPEEPTDD